MENAFSGLGKMALSEVDIADTETKVHDLKRAIEKVRLAHAERADVVTDLKHAKLSRLELLAEDLHPISHEIPDDNEMFEFAISRGETPRLWIDMTSFVRMGADGREFEFVKDTRNGRKILGHSPDRGAIGEVVIAYVAERILDREREIEGDWILYSEQSRLKDVPIEETMPEEAEETEQDNVHAFAKPKASSGLRGFLVGIALLVVIVSTLLYFANFQAIAKLLGA